MRLTTWMAGQRTSNIGVDAPAMLSLTLVRAGRAVIVATLADDQIQAVVAHPHDDLLDHQHANNTFARSHGRPLRMPSALSCRRA